MRQRPQLLHHAVLRAAHRPDPVAGVVGPELHRHRPFQHRANALVHRLGRGPLRVPDRGRDLQNVAARHRRASCRLAGTRSRRKHTPPLPGQAAGRAEGRPRRVRLRQSRPRDIDRAPLVGRGTAGLGGRSGDKAGPFEIVTVVRTCREMERARTILGNWAEAPAASGPSDPARREIACIEQAIRGMDDAVIEEHGGLQGLPRADRRAEGPAPVRAARNGDRRVHDMAFESASRGRILTAGRRGSVACRACTSTSGCLCTKTPLPCARLRFRMSLAALRLHHGRRSGDAVPEGAAVAGATPPSGCLVRLRGGGSPVLPTVQPVCLRYRRGPGADRCHSPAISVRWHQIWSNGKNRRSCSPS